MRISRGLGKARCTPSQIATSLRCPHRTRPIQRRSAQADGEGGVVANYRSLEALAIQTKLLRMDGVDFLLYDSGPGDDRILLVGVGPNQRALRNATVWGADGTFEVRPNLRAQVYTIHAVSSGYCIPCIYALLPGTSPGAYATMWGQVRDLVGDDADRARLLTGDFERAAISEFEETFPKSTVAG